MNHYELLSEWLLNSFFLTDWERTWLEARFEVSEEDVDKFNEILKKYSIKN
jgi:hypothetical protein